MPGVRITITDKNSGTTEIHESKQKEKSTVQKEMDSSDYAYRHTPDEISKLTEQCTCSKGDY
jgi:hypothetical protein